MLQLTPQSRVFLAREPADFRRYVQFTVMRSWRAGEEINSNHQ